MILLSGAAFLCLGCGIGCWLGAAYLPHGPVAGITALAAFVSAGLAIVTASVWAQRGAGQAWPLAGISALALAATAIGFIGGKRRGWD